MFLKSLIILNLKTNEVIREVKFRMGLNLVVDESNKDITGNGVGKTTFLKLIDFCLGKDKKAIYTDDETKKEYENIKKFLVEQNILITLVLKENLEIADSQEIVIERNFSEGVKAIRSINGQKVLAQDFELTLLSLIFPNQKADKPTFRQIISHNMRYEDDTLNKTLQTLDKYTTDVEYETLHLYLLGCDTNVGDTKNKVTAAITQENKFKNRLEKSETKTGYESQLFLIDDDIKMLNDKKASLNVNDNFEKDLDKLNNTKYAINKISSEISILSIRKDIILEAQEELKDSNFNSDLKQLGLIYQQATKNIGNIQRTFDELVNYHNQMVVEKIKFITGELPSIEANLLEKEASLKKLLEEEKSVAELVAKSDSFADLEKIIQALTENFRKKGEYENIIKQIEETEKHLKDFNKELSDINDILFADDFELIVKTQRDKFNRYFANISNGLYNDKYFLNYDATTKKGQKFYKFSIFDTNKAKSSGTKQGEIFCFDIAYILFADAEHISCLHFVLNDKKELMDDKQLVKIADLVDRSNIQFVVAILKDKLPAELNKEEYFRLKLSQNDKLFRLESLK